MKQLAQPSPEPFNLALNLSAGLIIGLLQVFLAISFAALIFSGDLSIYLAQGISLALIGMIVTGLIIARFSSLPGIIGGSQGAPAAILAVSAAAIAAAVPAGGSSPESFTTVVVTIALVSLAAGLVFWLIGYFHLGSLVRFLPYPVIGGFLAGAGWLFIAGGINIMLDMPLELDQIRTLLQPEFIARWLPGLLLAVVILLATRRWDHYLVLPAILVASLLLFFVIVLLGDMSLTELQSAGWLLGNISSGEGVFWLPSLGTQFAAVHWPAILDQLGNILAIIAVSAISLLLNAESMELITNDDLEVNRQLRVSGVSNVIAGLFGGFVGFDVLGLSALNFKLGSHSRLPGLIAAGICVIVLFSGVSSLAFLPKIIIGSIALYLGLNSLYVWVFESWFKLAKLDYAIVLAILLVTMFVGFLEAVALGVLLAVAFFVVSYSRIDLIHHELNGATYLSRMARSRPEENILKDLGDRQYILQLRGYIFFGTADSLLNNIRRRIEDNSRTKPQFIVLDFRRVTGLDSTGVLKFKRMKQLADNDGITLVLTRISGDVLNKLEQDGLGDDGRTVRIFPSLDEGVEWCEEQLLREAGLNRDLKPSLLVHFAEILDEEAGQQTEEIHLSSLMTCLQKTHVDAGQMIITRGEAPDDLYFIEHGQVTVQLASPGQPPIRLETNRSGTVFGEIGFYLQQQRTADVIADTPCVLYRLTNADLAKLEASDSELAATLHKIIVHLLAQRLVKMDNSFQAQN